MNHPCLHSHDRPWGAVLRKQAQAILRLRGWMFLCQVHPPLLSSYPQLVKYESISSTTRKSNRRNTSLLDKTIGSTAGSSLSIGTCDHHHYRPSVPVGSSFQLPVYSWSPAATSFSGSLWLLHLLPCYVSSLLISHSSRHYSDLPIYFLLLILSSSMHEVTLPPKHTLLH